MSIHYTKWTFIFFNIVLLLCFNENYIADRANFFYGSPNPISLLQKWRSNDSKTMLFLLRPTVFIFCMFWQHLNSKQYDNWFYAMRAKTYSTHAGKIFKLIPSSFKEHFLNEHFACSIDKNWFWRKKTVPVIYKSDGNEVWTMISIKTHTIAPPCFRIRVVH